MSEEGSPQDAKLQTYKMAVYQTVTFIAFTGFIAALVLALNGLHAEE